MKKIGDLMLGFGDAESYLKRGNKDFFNYAFVQNRYLDLLLDPNRYFLIGEKGTGKTAYSAFLANNRTFQGNVSVLKFVRETEYVKFIKLKQSHNLDLSDYSDIWCVVILLLLADTITKDEIENNLLTKSLRIKALNDACDEFYDKAFAPEIAQAIRFVEESNATVGLVQKNIKLKVGEASRTSTENALFQTNLLYLRKQFVAALGQLKLKDNHLLFIDGIDMRPGEIPYEDYLACVKGLANAVWRLNNDVFPGFRDSKGRFRVVMLARPDIFNSLGLQNSANKIRDNSVYLDWDTSYADCLNSDLFMLSDKLLSWQQEYANQGHGAMWRHYFPWRMSDVSEKNAGRDDNSFVYFLKMAYCRPRDIISALSCLQETAVKMRMANKDVFPVELVKSMEFKNKYSELLLMGIKDQLAFYYTVEEYQLFRDFFMYLSGRCEFNYYEYRKVFDEYRTKVNQSVTAAPKFLKSAETFLQFLYDMNVLGYKEICEEGNYFRWCYRERSISNPAPRVELGSHYVVHYGLRKALNLGYACRLDR